MSQEENVSITIETINDSFEPNGNRENLEAGISQLLAGGLSVAIGDRVFTSLAEFTDWYDLKHISRMSMPEVLSEMLIMAKQWTETSDPSKPKGNNRENKHIYDYIARAKQHGYTAEIRLVQGSTTEYEVLNSRD